MYNSGSHYATDVYQLYSGLFTHMDITSIRNVTLSSGVNAETYAAEGSDNATDASLLFTNAATSGWENVSLAGVSPTNWTGEVYSQSTTGTLSRAVYVPGMTVALPPESTVVVKMYHAGSTGGGTKGSSSRTWTVAGTVELTNSTPTANMTVGLDFDLQNGSTIELDPLVGPAGGFSVGNLTFNGTFASAKLGPGAYTLLRVTENTLVPQGLLFTIYAEITTNDSTGKGNSSTGKGNSSTGSGEGRAPPGPEVEPLPTDPGTGRDLRFAGGDPDRHDPLRSGPVRVRRNRFGAEGRGRPCPEAREDTTRRTGSGCAEVTAGGSPGRERLERPIFPGRSGRLLANPPPKPPSRTPGDWEG